MQAVANPDRHHSLVLLSSAVLWLIAYFAARFALERTGWSDALRIGIAVMPVVPFTVFLMSLIQGVRRLDELERRIHLEALAVAFPATMILLMTLGLIELAVPLPKEDLSYRHVWAFLPLLYFIGLYASRRRYQ